MRWRENEKKSLLDDFRLHYQYGNFRYPPFLYGAGVWFGPGVDEPMPLLILDEEEVLVKEPLDIPHWPGEPLIIGQASGFTTSVYEALGDAYFGSALVIPCARPEPLAKVGSVLIDPATGTRGTVGVPVLRTLDGGYTADGFLTAGHTVSASGALVAQSRRRFRSYGPSLGQVFLREDPVAAHGSVSDPGFDIAVVDLDPGQLPIAPVSSGYAQLEVPVIPPVSVRIRGGFTRNGVSMICAGLFAGGSPRRQWKDCWILAPGVAVAGDSGGCVVTTPRQELVGMLVGGARQGGSSSFAIHYVQDHESVQEAVLTPAGVKLK